MAPDLLKIQLQAIKISTTNIQNRFSKKIKFENKNLVNASRRLV